MKCRLSAQFLNITDFEQYCRFEICECMVNRMARFESFLEIHYSLYIINVLTLFMAKGSAHRHVCNDWCQIKQWQVFHLPMHDCCIKRMIKTFLLIMSVLYSYHTQIWFLMYCLVSIITRVAGTMCDKN